MGLFHGEQKIEWYFYSPAYMEDGYYEKEPYGKKEKALLDKELTRSFLLADGKGSPRLDNLYSHIQNANNKHHQEIVRKSDNNYLVQRMFLPNGRKLDLSAVYPLQSINVADMPEFYANDKRLNIAAIRTNYKIDNRRKRFPEGEGNGGKDTDYLLGAYVQSKPDGSKFADVCQYLDLKPFFYKELREHKMWQRYIWGVLRFFSKMCVPARLLKDAQVFQYEIPFTDTPLGGGENGAEIMRALNNSITLRMLKKENIPGKPAKICFLGCEPDKTSFPGLFIYHNKYNADTDTYTQLALDLSLFFGESINTNIFGLIDSDGLSNVKALINATKDSLGREWYISALAPYGVSQNIKLAMKRQQDTLKTPIVEAVTKKLNSMPITTDLVDELFAEQDRDFYENIFSELKNTLGIEKAISSFNEYVKDDIKNLDKYKNGQGGIIDPSTDDSLKGSGIRVWYERRNSADDPNLIEFVTKVLYADTPSIAYDTIDKAYNVNKYKDKTISYMATIIANELLQGVKSKYEGKAWYNEVMTELEASSIDIAKLRENYFLFALRDSIPDDALNSDLNIVLAPDIADLGSAFKDGVPAGDIQVQGLVGYDVVEQYLDGYPSDYVVTGLEPVERVKCKIKYTVRARVLTSGDKDYVKFTEFSNTYDNVIGFWHDSVYDAIPAGYPQFGIGTGDPENITQLQEEYNKYKLANEQYCRDRGYNPPSVKLQKIDDIKYSKEYKKIYEQAPFYDEENTVMLQLLKYNKDTSVNWSTFSASTNPMLRMPTRLWRSIPYCAKKECFATTIWLAIHGETIVKYDKGLLKAVKIIVAVVLLIIALYYPPTAALAKAMAIGGATIGVAVAVADAFGNTELAKALGYIGMAMSVISVASSLQNISSWGFKDWGMMIVSAGTTVTNLVLNNRTREIASQIQLAKQETEQMGKEQDFLEEQMGDVFYGIPTTKCYEDMGNNLELANTMINDYMYSVYSLAYEYPNIIYDTKARDPFS